MQKTLRAEQILPPESECVLGRERGREWESERAARSTRSQYRISLWTESAECGRGRTMLPSDRVSCHDWSVGGILDGNQMIGLMFITMVVLPPWGKLVP